MKRIIYTLNREKKAVRVTDEQAESIKKLMSVNPGGSTQMGTDYIPISSIKAITSDEDGKVNSMKVKELRRDLKNAAEFCFNCNGKGFVEVGDIYNPEMKMCECQVKVKERYGVSANDFSWNGYGE